MATTVTYDAASKTATLDPTANLAANTSYTAQLTSAIKDTANNSLAPLSWSFTTGAAGGGTTVSFGADADTYVSQASPTSSFGTSSSFSIVGGSGSLKQAFLRFTVSGLPTRATISSAKLRLYITSTCRRKSVSCSDDRRSTMGDGAIVRQTGNEPPRLCASDQIHALW